MSDRNIIGKFQQFLDKNKNIDINTIIEDNIKNIPIPTPPSPGHIHPICFSADSPIKTDQGIVAISRINKRNHTIKNKTIKELTITKNTSPMIFIPKNVLGKNLPSQDINVSLFHKILYNDKWYQARELTFINGIDQVLRGEELVYNILLDKHSVMNVAGLTVETLDPEVYFKLRKKEIKYDLNYFLPNPILC